MNRNERKLLDGVELHLPGAGPHVVAVYRSACDNPARGSRLAAALRSSMFARDPSPETLRLLRNAVEAAPPIRKGPKMERYLAAREALEELRKFAGEEVGQ